MSSRQWTVPQQIWKHPNPSFTRVEVFRQWVNHKHGLNLCDYHELHKYSISNREFWKDLWDFTGVVYSVPPKQIVEDTPQQHSPKWFIGARLNYAENLLIRYDDSIACTAIREHGLRIHYSYRDLRSMVQQMANAMKAYGLRPGDRVAAIVTNSIDPLVIMLATVSIGAIYSSTGTDMGVTGILDRYRQIRPKFIFSETDVIYSGKRVDLRDKVTQVARELFAGAGLSQVILLPSTVTRKNLSLSATDIRATFLETFLSKGGNEPLTFNQLPFSHPAFILYSSGTTGPPKCIVHSAGGVLMTSLKDYAFHMNVHRDDTYFQYTTCAWMMWNAMVNSLALGARIVLYDGSPFQPHMGRLLDIVNTERVTHFGTSPRYLSELQGRRVKISDYGSYESLRVIFVTGAILTAPAYIWTAIQFPTVHVLSGAGGTDICGSFVSGCTPLNGYAGELQVKSLGMDVAIYDEEGKDIQHTGEAGELVCTHAHPSLPLGFWGDDKRVKFFDAYYGKYPGVWAQGDLAVINPLTKGIYILGRSDGVLNPGGVRFGSGEIYAVMEKFGSVVDDCLCVGQRRPQDDDERVLLFVKMRPGTRCDEAFKGNVRRAIREALSARHVPSFIFEVPEIPYTVNNKKIEIAVKQIVSGKKFKPSGTVANPEALGLYIKYADLESIVAQESKVKL